MKSAVAGIIDDYGGLRVVVTDNGFHHHLRPGERLFVVPNFYVEEPVPWDMIPHLIAFVEWNIDWWIRTRNDPAALEDLPIKMYRLRCSRTYQRGSVHLPDIVET